MDLQIAGKTGLVTGASSGIGRGIALALAAEGVRLAIAARRGNLLRQVADEIAKPPRTIFSVPVAGPISGNGLPGRWNSISTPGWAKKPAKAWRHFAKAANRGGRRA